MQSIGIAYQGINSYSCNNGQFPIWIGSDGPNVFSFTNNAGVPITLVMWNFANGNHEMLFMSKYRPQVTYSLGPGDCIDISVGNTVSGGWAGLYNHETDLYYGLVHETMGEFTTGSDATVDVSREVNMSGHSMTVEIESSSCVTSTTLCSFWCKKGLGNECGDSGTYDLVNCDPQVTSGASNSKPDGINPEGGCQGWAWGGRLTVTFGGGIDPTW
jgi:hypothetical protein